LITFLINALMLILASKIDGGPFGKTSRIQFFNRGAASRHHVPLKGAISAQLRGEITAEGLRFWQVSCVCGLKHREGAWSWNAPLERLGQRAVAAAVEIPSRWALRPRLRPHCGARSAAGSSK